MNNLEAIQIELENEQVNIGVKRYRDAVASSQERGQETSLNPQHRLLVTAIKPLSDKLKEEINSTKAGRKRTAGKLLEGIDTDVLAFLTCQIILNGISNRMNTVAIEMRIATSIREYLGAEQLKKEQPHLYKYALDGAMKTSNANFRRVHMRHYVQWADLSFEEERINCLTGAYLLELFIQTSGLVEKHNFISGGKTKQILRAKPEVMQWLNEQHSQNELMSPYWLPMVVKPLAWSNPFDGGYKTIGLSVIKSGNKNYLQELENTDIPNIYRAINALQETPWRVNQTVLDVVNNLWDTGVETDVLPPRDSLSNPPKPCADDEVDVFKVSHPTEWREWRRKAAAVHTQNTRLESKKLALVQRLWMANKFKEFDELYFPHTMDWRGRVYPVVPLLNPQADDLGKALLEFAVGAPLGDTGEYWLKVHLANTFGVDKVSMDERVKWADEHMTHIRFVANDPFTYKMWQEADSPWQFLAACFEFERYVQSGIGSSFISHLSINMDGSCNGLQNFSAMLRDPVGGKATNLIPQEKPADIYTEVAKVVQTKILADLNNPELDDEVKTLAKMWDGKVVRKLVKRQVMTLPYGSTEYGMRDQLKSELQSQRDVGNFVLGTADFELEWKAIGYLTAHIWSSIGEVVVAARQAMDWLKEAAKIASSINLPLHWYSPSGLPVLQDYRKTNEKIIDTFLGKVRIKRTLAVQVAEVSSRKQANGVAPNFVHSCDASHMISTINRCLDAGIVDFCMIHDSYGTHAGNLGRLQEELREAFIEQYSEEVLVKLWKALTEQTGLDIPKPPAIGCLSLDGIRDSKYFFA